MDEKLGNGGGMTLRLMIFLYSVLNALIHFLFLRVRLDSLRWMVLCHLHGECSSTVHHSTSYRFCSTQTVRMSSSAPPWPGREMPCRATLAVESRNPPSTSSYRSASVGGPSPSIRSAADVGCRSENRSLSREEGFKSLHFMGIDDSGQHEHRQLANRSRELLLVGPF